MSPFAMDPANAGYSHLASIEDGDIANRKFETSAYDDYRSNPCIYRSNPKGGHWYHVECSKYTRCPECSQRPCHSNSLVIAVDGGCRNNGSPDAIAAFAAYIHPYNSTYNSSVSMPNSAIKTNQRAELSAGLLALDTADEIKHLNDPRWADDRVFDKGPEVDLSQVVIKSDSEYLVKGMTEWIHNWKKNDFRNAKKKPVVNADLFKSIDTKVNALNRLGVQVQCWHVPREQNKMADYLVNCKLDGLTAKQAMEKFLEYHREGEE